MLDYYRGKRVAVLGATGLIGSYCVEQLLHAGAVVQAISHRRQNAGPYLRAPIGGAYDLADPYQARDAIARCEVVVNCAGITGGVGLTKKDPVSYVGPATAIACNVFDACHRAKARCGFLSSTTVYTPREVPCVEDFLGSEEHLYPAYRGIGQSKRFLEGLCAYYRETVGLEVAVVRPSGAYGRHDNFDEQTSHVVPGLVNRALALKPGEPFEVWGDGGDVRDIVHARDVARGFLLAIAKWPVADPINIASGVGVPTAELARMVLDAVGSRAELEFRTDKPTALRTRLVSVEKAKRLLGFRAEVGLAEGLHDVVQWRRECAS